MNQWSDRLRGLVRENFIAEDLDPHLPRIELIGGRRGNIENHRGIIEYSDIEMRVALSDGELDITGHDMELRALTLTELTIAGVIDAIAYRRQGSGGGGSI